MHLRSSRKNHGEEVILNQEKGGEEKRNRPCLLFNDHAGVMILTRDLDQREEEKGE